MFKYKPFSGWGLLGIYYAGGDVYHYTRTFHGHNFWITIMTTLGVVGLSVFIYMKYHLLKELKLLSQNNCRLTPLLAGILTMILGQGLLDFTIMNPQGGIIFFGSSALISGLAFQYDYFAVRDFYSTSLRVKNRKI
jgi:O-antigen ligase